MTNMYFHEKTHKVKKLLSVFCWLSKEAESELCISFVAKAEFTSTRLKTFHQITNPAFYKYQIHPQE